MGGDVRYGKVYQAPAQRRHPLAFVVGPLYPLLVAVVLGSASVWYLDIPMGSEFDSAVREASIHWQHLIGPIRDFLNNI